MLNLSTEISAMRSFGLQLNYKNVNPFLSRLLCLIGTAMPTSFH